MADRDADKQQPSIRLFGCLELPSEAQSLPGPGLRLLAWLLLAGGRPRSRGEAGEQLWPDAVADRQRFYLRRALTQLRKGLWPGAELHAEGEFLQLKPHMPVDVASFDARLRSDAADDWELAAGLYRGPLLQGWKDDWLMPERESRRLAWLETIERLARRDLEKDMPAAAARRLAHAVQADPLREVTTQLLIEALRRSGDDASAKALYERFRTRLWKELGVEPTVQTRSVLRQPLAPPLRPAPVETAPRLLPCPLTPLLGRISERTSIREDLAETRLVTLVGPGGIGKTRLAIAVAEDLSGGQDLTAMVDLTVRSEADESALWSLLADSLRLSEGGERPSVVITRHFGDRRVLLLIDNCEHLLGAASDLVASLLANNSGVRILATSRQPLGLPDERIVDVAGLDPITAQDLLIDASRRKGRPIGDDERSLVRDICAGVDYMPLAIVLAAGALRTASLKDLSERPLEMLSLAPSTGKRQSSMKAAAHWSFGLLSEDELRVLRRVSLLRGRWTLEFAHAAVGEDIGEAELRSMLGILANMSLLQVEDDDRGALYRMLEPIRHEANALLPREEADEAWQGLRDHALEWSGEIYERLSRRDAATLDRVEHVLESVDCILQHLIANAGDAPAATIILSRFYPFFDRSSRYSTVIGYLERCLSETRHWPVGLQTVANLLLIHMRLHSGESVDLLQLAEESEKEATASCDPYWKAFSSNVLGTARYVNGDFQGARDCYVSAMSRWLEARVPEGVEHCLVWAGRASFAMGDYEAAERYFDQGLERCVESGDRGIEAMLLLNLARLRLRTGDLVEAESLFARAERQLGQLHNYVHEAKCKVGRGACLLARGEADGARLVAEAIASVSYLARDDVLFEDLGEYDPRINAGMADFETAKLRE